MNGFFKMVSVADLHFGNPRTNPAQLYNNLCDFLYPELVGAHLVTVNGDVYDQLLTVNSYAHRYATMFINDLFTISAKTGLQVRILHGTFSHDRDQLSIFSSLAYPKTRFKIVNQIEAEEINNFQYESEELNMSLRVGYLPDNLSHTTATEAVEHLKRVMQVLGYTSLDLLIGHGTFAHALPADTAHMPPCTYNLEQFDKVVQGPIVMGHIHTSSRKYNCYYCGSFERMAHGEEENKGFYVFTRDVENKEGWRSKFVINKKATPFITITPKGDDIPSLTRDYVDQVKQRFPDLRGFVRVVNPSSETRNIIHRVSSQQFPNITFSGKSSGTAKEHELKVTEINLDIEDEVKPSTNNLASLICKFLEERNELEEVETNKLIETVNKLIQEYLQQ